MSSLLYRQTPRPLPVFENENVQAFGKQEKSLHTVVSARLLHYLVEEFFKTMPHINKVQLRDKAFHAERAIAFCQCEMSYCSLNREF